MNDLPEPPNRIGPKSQREKSHIRTRGLKRWPARSGTHRELTRALRNAFMADWWQEHIFFSLSAHSRLNSRHDSFPIPCRVSGIDCYLSCSRHIECANVRIYRHVMTIWWSLFPYICYLALRFGTEEFPSHQKLSLTLGTSHSHLSMDYKTVHLNWHYWISTPWPPLSTCC